MQPLADPKCPPLCVKRGQVSSPFPFRMDLRLLRGSEWKHLVQTSAPDAHPLIPSRGLIVQQGLPRSLDGHRLVRPAPVAALRAVSVPAVPAAEGQGDRHGRSRGGPEFLSGRLQPAGPVARPARAPTPCTPTCACGSCGSGQTCRSSPSTGTRCPWRPNAAPCSAPGPQAGAFWGAPLPPPSGPASSGQGAPSGSQPSP